MRLDYRCRRMSRRQLFHIGERIMQVYYRCGSFVDSSSVLGWVPTYTWWLLVTRMLVVCMCLKVCQPFQVQQVHKKLGGPLRLLKKYVEYFTFDFMQLLRIHPASETWNESRCGLLSLDGWDNSRLGPKAGNVCGVRRSAHTRTTYLGWISTTLKIRMCLRLCMRASVGSKNKHCVCKKLDYMFIFYQFTSHSITNIVGKTCVLN